MSAQLHALATTGSEAEAKLQRWVTEVIADGSEISQPRDPAKTDDDVSCISSSDFEDKSMVDDAGADSLAESISEGLHKLNIQASAFSDMDGSHELRGVQEGLAKLHKAGWNVDWVAIRRRFNKYADRIATHVVKQARNLFPAGRLALARVPRPALA